MPSTAAILDKLLPLSPLDFHVLLVLAAGPKHGYGIMKSVAEQTGGALKPEIGSLYRMLNRLVTNGVLEEAPAESVPDLEGDGRGKTRRFYRITQLGRDALRAEAARMERALELARGV